MFDEPGHVAGGHAQQVRDDQHLAITALAGPDANGRDLQLGRDLGGDFSGDALQHESKGAGILSRLRVGHQPIGVALHLVATHLVHGLRAQPDMAHDRDTGTDQRRDRLGLGHRAFQLDGLAARFLDDPRGVLDRGRGRDLEGGKRHVDYHQRPLHGPAHHFGMVDDLVQGDVQRVVVALHHHRQAVPHQDRIHSRLVQQARHRVIVGSQHADLPLLGLQGGEAGDGHTRLRVGHMAVSGWRGLCGNSCRIVTVRHECDNLTTKFEQIHGFPLRRAVS